MMSMLLVLNNFIRKRTITKSTDERWNSLSQGDIDAYKNCVKNRLVKKREPPMDLSKTGSLQVLPAARLVDDW